MELARHAAAAALATRGVASLSPGRHAASGTFGAGETIHGVVLRRGAGRLDAHVSIVAAWDDGGDLHRLAARVQRAVGRTLEAHFQGRVRVHVAIDDIRSPSARLAEGDEA